TVSELGSAFGSAFMIALTAIFILLEASGFPKKLSAMAGAAAARFFAGDSSAVFLDCCSAADARCVGTGDYRHNGQRVHQ
ncbi:MAG: hypothetical protein ABGZ24_14185, partial [Fuerstiella sp.]